MASSGRFACATVTSCLLVAALVRCSSFDADSDPPALAVEAAVDAPIGDGGGDAGLVDSADPGACVELLSDELMRTNPRAAPWDDSTVEGTATGSIVEIDGGARTMFVQIPSTPGIYVLFKNIPETAQSLELDYDTFFALGSGGGGSDGGQPWVVALPLVSIAEPGGAVQLGPSVYSGLFILAADRKLPADAGVNDASVSATLSPFGSAHVHMLVKFGSAGGAEVAIKNAENGLVQQQSISFAQGAGARRLAFGVYAVGAAPAVTAAFANIRACTR